MTPNPRILIADRLPASRERLVPVFRQAGWDFVTVESSFQVLRTIRDAGVNVLLIDPDLPGVGVTGVDVVRTIKSAVQFRHLPVVFLLHGDRAAPEDVGADGALAVDRAGTEAVLAAVRGAVAGRPGAARAANGAAPDPRPAPAPASTEDAQAAVARAAEEAVRRYAADALEPLVAGIVRELAREIVPAVAERVLREEIARLRRDYGLDPPR